MTIKSFDNLQIDPMHHPSWLFEGYSDFWRSNKSTLEPVELANVLRALRKVAGHIGSGVGSVEWEGMKENNSHTGTIKLPSAFALGNYPILPGKMDMLVGIVVHEAMHQQEWSDYVWLKLNEATKRVDSKDKDVLWRLYNAGEDIYVNALAQKSVLGLYVKRLRETFGRGEISKVITPGALFELWKRYVLDEQKGVSEEYSKTLEILVKASQRLIKIADESKSVSTRCNLRSIFYKELWEQIKGYISEWERDKIIYSDMHQEKQEGRVESMPVQQQVMPLALSHQIEWSLADGSCNLTPLIKGICGTDDKSVIPTSLWEFNTRVTPVVDPYLVARLKAIFQTYAERVSLIERGLESGKVDRKRLYRAATTSCCFMSKQSAVDIAWDIVLVVDCSKSMEGPKGKMVEDTSAAVVKALEGQRNRVKVFGYFEQRGVCIVSPLLRGGVFYTVPPHGQTPSGQAIIAAALQMPKGRRRRFLVHITDGESNCGCSVEKALDFCKREGVDTITLGCAYRERDILVKQYGDSLQLLDYIEQLPKALEVLFSRKLLYGR